MSKFHNIIIDITLEDGKRLTADKKASGLWLFRFTYRKGKKDVSIMTCLVSEHEDLAPFECYVENVWNSQEENYDLRVMQPLFQHPLLMFHTVYFERSLDKDARLIKWSIHGGRVGTGRTMNFR